MMTKSDYVLGVLCAFGLGLLVNSTYETHVKNTTVKYPPRVDCEAVFVNLSAEQIMTIETCNTGAECYALAKALGVPEECAE